MKKSNIFKSFIFLTISVLIIRSNYFVFNLDNLIVFLNFQLNTYRFRKANQENFCIPLQNNIEDIIEDSRDNWSISILDHKLGLISDVNGNIKRIPASNQKLFTTAYSLDVLGPYHRLTTSLFKNEDGYYEIHGSGDPDFNLESLIKLRT